MLEKHTVELGDYFVLCCLLVDYENGMFIGKEVGSRQ